MSIRFKQELQDLQAELGCTVADLLPEELELLFDACRRLDNPYSALNAQLIERPVFAARDLYVWPITAGAVIWLTEFAGKWWPGKSRMFSYAQLYAVVNARNPYAFIRLQSKSSARTAVLKCALRLCLHGAELSHLLNLAYGIQHDTPKTAAEKQREKRLREVEQEMGEDFAGVVARLEVASGIPAKSWLWERSLAALYKSYIELSHLASAALKGAAKDEAKLELDAAIANLARVRALIAERIAGKTNTPITPESQQSPKSPKRNTAPSMPAPTQVSPSATTHPTTRLEAPPPHAHSRGPTLHPSAHTNMLPDNPPLSFSES